LFVNAQDVNMVENEKAGLGTQTKTAARNNTTRLEARPGDTNG